MTSNINGNQRSVANLKSSKYKCIDKSKSENMHRKCCREHGTYKHAKRYQVYDKYKYG